MYSLFSNQSRVPARGFTLIELLVVLAAIGILTAILVPAIEKARGMSQSAACVANLRQLGAASLLYSSENDRLVPMATRTSDGTIKIWRAYIAPYVGNSIDVFICPSNPKESGRSFTTSEKTQIDIGIRPTSYGLNNYWSNMDSSHWLHEYMGKLSEQRNDAIQNPAGMILLSDIGLVINPAADPSQWRESDSGANYGYARMPNEPAFRGGDAWNIFPRHGATANVVFYDGHVGSVNIAQDILPHPPESTHCLYDNK